jgi:hypothetical protein
MKGKPVGQRMRPETPPPRQQRSQSALDPAARDGRLRELPSTPTRDTLGPMTRTVRNAAIMLDVIAGYPSRPVRLIVGLSAGAIGQGY